MYQELHIPLDARIKLGVGDIEELSTYPVREELSPRWAPKRLREFKAGRTLARQMLTQLDVSYDTIPADPDRVPLWPNGIVGSISHTNEKILVAAASEEFCHCLGVDAEPEDSVSPELYPRLFVPAELEVIESGEAAGTDIFCCKEAVYKAVYPRCREFFDFPDICIKLSGNRFQVQCLNHSLSSRSLIIRGRGHMFEHKKHRIALFFVSQKF